VSSDYWREWIEYLRRAEKRGGFRVKVSRRMRMPGIRVNMPVRIRTSSEEDRGRPFIGQLGKVWDTGLPESDWVIVQFDYAVVDGKPVRIMFREADLDPVEAVG
jgi:hypothetical protein